MHLRSMLATFSRRSAEYCDLYFSWFGHTLCSNIVTLQETSSSLTHRHVVENTNNVTKSYRDAANNIGRHVGKSLSGILSATPLTATPQNIFPAHNPNTSRTAFAASTSRKASAAQTLRTFHRRRRRGRLQRRRRHGRLMRRRRRNRLLRRRHCRRLMRRLLSVTSALQKVFFYI